MLQHYFEMSRKIYIFSAHSSNDFVEPVLPKAWKITNTIYWQQPFDAGIYYLSMAFDYWHIE